MDRRQVLTTLGAGAVAGTAGCTGLLFSSCDPGEDELGDVAEKAGERRVEVSFRATVEEVREDASTELIVSDGTSKARLYASSINREFDTDLIDEGDCVEGEGTALKADNRDSEMLVIGVTSLEAA